MRGPKPRRWPFVVGFNVLAIALVLGAAELAVRLIPGASYNQDEQLAMCRPDASTIWRYRPDISLSYKAPEFDMQIRTNADGLRGGPVSPSDDIATILVIGDSFTFGWGVTEDQRYSEVIGRLIAQAVPGTQVRIINAGYWMYTFDQQLVLMKQLIARYHPKVVVQDFYWMHIRTLFGHQYERAADGTLLAVTDSKIMVNERGVLKFRSDLLERPPLHSQLVAFVARAILNRDLRERAGEWMGYMRPGPQNADLWAVTEALVDETIRTVRAAGIAYIPFLLPVSIEFPGGNWANVGWGGSTPPADVDVTLPGARLAAMFARRGVDIVELAPRMRARAAGHDGPALYYPQDGHWTAAGHALAAEILAPYVTQALAPQP
jgi:hypothetical protein